MTDQSQIATTQDAVLTVRLPGRPAEAYEFSSAEVARKRAAFISEAHTWVGTPFRDCADVKGPQGAVDCAMMLTRSAVDAGLVEPFDPRPYSPRLMLHSTEEKSAVTFLKILAMMGAVEVPEPAVGDVVVWQFGRMFSHGAVLVSRGLVVHAYAADGFCTVSGTDAPLLKGIGIAGLGVDVPRPVKYFALWGR